MAPSTGNMFPEAKVNFATQMRREGSITTLEEHE